MAKAKPVVPAELDALFGKGPMITKPGYAPRLPVPVQDNVLAGSYESDIDTGLPPGFDDVLPEFGPRVLKEEGAAVQLDPSDPPGRAHTVGAIYPALNAVHRELARVGMAKDSRNASQGFNFRGIDGLYNLVSALLAKNNILTLPQMGRHEITLFPSKSGGTMFRATLEAEYRFVSTLDGSFERVTVIGEAMDSGDKATNKAMSIAHKYALIQAFNIPLVGSDDPDLESPEVTHADPRQAPRRIPEKSAHPFGFDGCAVESEASFDAAVEAGADPILIHIESLTSNEERRTLLTTKVLEAYGALTLDQIPEDRVEEAKANLTSYVEAQKKKAAKK